MQPSSMGSFGKLSAEVRLLIWEQSLSDGSTSIMATSRAIYEDIGSRLYNTMDIHLYPVYNKPWMWVTCRRLRLSWPFGNRNGCSCDLVQNMPHDKINLTINVYAPDPQNRFQVILLWMKIQALVDILRAAPASKSIEIKLRPGSGNSWKLDTANTREDLGSRLEYGQDAIFVLFCGLRNVRSITLPHARITTPQKNPGLDALVTDIGFTFDPELDRLPEQTASILRLERFATWSESPIREAPHRTIKTIRLYPNTIAIHDPALSKVHLRHKLFDILNLITLHDPSKERYTKWTYPTWQDWLTAYPDGIHELSEELLRAESQISSAKMRIRTPHLFDGIPSKWRKRIKVWRLMEAHNGRICEHRPR
ncbi:uncharacterized protein APUU_20419S [Aspergillus puulaauensis]|uniref:Uncharacterized protein n=1 Tax=Aspergillus puulaauensis TaxID=1220207 RepID=A0A7R7XEK3_9EURO|nr:uncharacterized protein APUU_20419S [Aspergillus puulaauensis]BCS19987.1 hypothetical protein APUU_20419S [Aspergillus puulaauensis]